MPSIRKRIELKRSITGGINELYGTVTIKERLGLKRRVLNDLEQLIPKDAKNTSNSSEESVSISNLEDTEKLEDTEMTTPFDYHKMLRKGDIDALNEAAKNPNRFKKIKNDSEFVVETMVNDDGDTLYRAASPSQKWAGDWTDDKDEVEDEVYEENLESSVDAKQSVMDALKLSKTTKNYADKFGIHVSVTATWETDEIYLATLSLTLDSDVADEAGIDIGDAETVYDAMPDGSFIYAETLAWPVKEFAKKLPKVVKDEKELRKLIKLLSTAPKEIDQ